MFIKSLVSLKKSYHPCLFKRHLSSAWRMPPFQQLTPFWKEYFHSADGAIQENFWGSLATFKKAYAHHDAYANQLAEMGYSFDEKKEAPASFYQAISWTLEKLRNLKL